MKLHLVNVDTSNAGNEQAGTCELCFRTEWHDNPVFVFTTDAGKAIKVEGYWWDWGDYDQVYVDNYIEFDNWLEQQEFPDDTKFNQEWLIELIGRYDEAHTEEEE